MPCHYKIKNTERCFNSLNSEIFYLLYLFERQRERINSPGFWFASHMPTTAGLDQAQSKRLEFNPSHSHLGQDLAGAITCHRPGCATKRIWNWKKRKHTHTRDAPGAVLTTTIIINFPGIRHADGKQQSSQNSSAQPVPIPPTPASSVNPSYSLLPLLLFLALSILNIEMCKPHLSFNPLYALTKFNKCQAINLQISISAYS